MNNIIYPNLEDCLLLENSTKGYVYDIETYPNFFCISFYDGRRFITFEISSRKNELQKILNFITIDKILIGYNNQKFDDLIVKYLMRNGESLKRVDSVQLCKNIQEIANESIRFFQENQQSEIIKEIRSSRRGFHSIDLMQAGGFQKGLKLLGVSLKYPYLQDLPYHFESELNSQQMDNVIDYNYHDLKVTFSLLCKLRDKIELRHQLCKIYYMELLSDSDSVLANKIFEKLYRERSSNPDFKEGRTHRDLILVKDCIMPQISFKSKELKDVLEYLKQCSVIKDGNDGLKFEVPLISYKGKKYRMGIGGLHSDDEPNQFTNSDSLLIDSDVTSYYPNLMINHKIKPAHLENIFLDILKNLKEERVEAKKQGNKTKAEAFKIVINSVFGKLGFPGYFLYDNLAMLQVTLNGQLYLLMLIEKLSEAGFEVISANTDGIITKVPRDKQELYKSLCEEWENETNLELEYTRYKKYIRRDVNNYIAQTEDGKIKSKGCFLQEIDLFKGYSSPVVAQVLKKYYIDDQSIEKSLREHSDIYDFCIAQKMGKQFTAEFNEVPVQNSVRFYVSKAGGKLFKVKEVEGSDKKSYTDLCSGYSVQLFNNFSERKDYQIDYDFYIKEVQKITKEINKATEVLW